MSCCRHFPSMSVWSQYDAIKSCHIYNEDKNLLFYFGSDWIRSVWNGLNLTKFVQIGSKKIKMDGIDCFCSNQINWFKLDKKNQGKIGSFTIKSDKTGSDKFLLIFWYPIGWKNKTWIKLGLIDSSHWFLDIQLGEKWKLDKITVNWSMGAGPSPLLYPLPCYLWFLKNLA